MSYITSDQLLPRLRKEIEEINVHELASQMENGENLTLIDIRELDEWSQGRIEGAIHIPRGFLELQIETHVSGRSRPIAVLCAGGVRSLLGARDLETMGYTNVVSVAGGFNGWKNAGYSFTIPRILNDEQRQRYSRHTVMPEIGEAGQLKLLDARCLAHRGRWTRQPGRHLPGRCRGRHNWHR